MGKRIIQTEKGNLDRKVRDKAVSRGGFKVQTTVIDITERKHTVEKLNPIREILRKAMGGSIEVIADTVETRDNYTARHQRRTAELARAIAGEMGLAEDQQNGLLMAGSIHDLGKISIPAEILSKPGQADKARIQNDPDPSSNRV